MSASKPQLDDLRIERSDAPRRRSRGWPVVAVLGIAGLVGAGAAVWWSGHARAAEVRTAVARAAEGGGADRTVLNASGYVTARLEATVSSKVTGKVMEVLIEEGMKVKAGQVLARLDDSNVMTSLALAQAQLAAARAALDQTNVRLKEAEQDLARETDLAKNNVVAVSDLDHAQADAAAYRAQLTEQHSQVVVAERTLAVYRQQLDDTVIRAPFAGIVTSKDAQPGEMISPISAGGGFTRTGVCTIVDMKSLEIEVDVNESYIDRVEVGQPVTATLDAYPDWQIPCHVIAIIPTADRSKSTVRVRVGFDHLDPRILPEMSVKVAFRDLGKSVPASTRTVFVPRGALQTRGDGTVVFVVRNGRAERRAVTVLNAAADQAEISAGLAAGETVVVDPPPNLKDGEPVKAINP